MAGMTTLILNDGPVDAVLHSKKYMDARIRIQIEKNRRLKTREIAPTLSYIKETHVLYVTACFKPHVAVGYEYHKTKADGEPRFGNASTFNIKMFGDFIHDCVAIHKIGQVDSLPITITRMPAGLDWDGVTAGDFDYSYITPFGDVELGPTITYKNLIQYCEYPGERLHKGVSFSADGKSIDSYTSDVLAILRQQIAEDKLEGYKRCVGQGTEAPSTHLRIGRLDEWRQIPYLNMTHEKLRSEFAHLRPLSNLEIGQPITMGGTYEDPTWFRDQVQSQYDGPQSATAPVVPLTNSSHLIGEPVPTFVNHLQTLELRTVEQVLHGPQVPKYTLPPLELAVPLQYWFCRDAAASLPCSALSCGEKLILIDYEEFEKIVYTSPGMYVAQHDYTNGRIEIRPLYNKSELVVPSLTSDLYCNGIYVENSVHDIMMDRVSTSLIRVFRHQKMRATNQLALNMMKYPTESLWFGFRPKTKTNHNEWQDWHRHTLLTEVETPPNLVSNFIPGPDPTRVISGINQESYYIDLPVVDSIAFNTPEFALVEDTPLAFRYSQYKFDRKMAQDGLYCLNFAVCKEGDNFDGDETRRLVENDAHTTSRQDPSGHLNLSIAKLCLSWESDFPHLQVDLVAVCLNFLTVTRQTAALKYSL